MAKIVDFSCCSQGKLVSIFWSDRSTTINSVDGQLVSMARFPKTEIEDSRCLIERDSLLIIGNYKTGVIAAYDTRDGSPKWVFHDAPGIYSIRADANGNIHVRHHSGRYRVLSLIGDEMFSERGVDDVWVNCAGLETARMRSGGGDSGNRIAFYKNLDKCMFVNMTPIDSLWGCILYDEFFIGMISGKSVIAHDLAGKVAWRSDIDSPGRISLITIDRCRGLLLALLRDGRERVFWNRIRVLDGQCIEAGVLQGDVYGADVAGEEKYLLRHDNKRIEISTFAVQAVQWQHS